MGVEDVIKNTAYISELTEILTKSPEQMSLEELLKSFVLELAKELQFRGPKKSIDDIASEFRNWDWLLYESRRPSLLEEMLNPIYHKITQDLNSIQSNLQIVAAWFNKAIGDLRKKVDNDNTGYLSGLLGEALSVIIKNLNKEVILPDLSNIHYVASNIKVPIKITIKGGVGSHAGAHSKGITLVIEGKSGGLLGFYAESSEFIIQKPGPHMGYGARNSTFVVKEINPFGILEYSKDCTLKALKQGAKIDKVLHTILTNLYGTKIEGFKVVNIGEMPKEYVKNLGRYIVFLYSELFEQVKEVPKMSVFEKVGKGFPRDIYFVPKHDWVEELLPDILYALKNADTIALGPHLADVYDALKVSIEELLKKQKI